MLNTVINTTLKVVRMFNFRNQKIRNQYKWRLKNLISYQYLRNKKLFFFVIIGANDGTTGEIIYDIAMKENLSGICVEPIADIHQELTKAYKENINVKCINAAIHSTKKSIKMYKVKPGTNYPNWAHGINSFKKNHLLKAKVSESDILEEEVMCYSLSELFEKENILKIDYLQIDVEGYDFEVLKMLDFSKYKPEIIRFEDTSLSRNEVNRAYNLLEDNGYSLWRMESDTVAVLLNKPGWNWQD